MTGPSDSPGHSAELPAPRFDAPQAVRVDMVEKQIRARGVRDPRVLAAMRVVPRHAFVPPELAAAAYDDLPLPIGEGQTISQPYMVASMTEALELSGAESVLEIGTGCGYQTAVLSLLAREVYSMESRLPLAEAARQRLAALGYQNVQVLAGDGTLGWPDDKFFDAILVTAAAPEVPPPLMAQLAEGGRLVLPMGGPEEQRLMRLHRRAGVISTERFYPCRFVPLIGRYGQGG